MYTNIADNELVQYHGKVKVNTHFRLTDIITNTDGLFIVTQQGSTDVYKIIPLFYCESISSSNDDDTVIEENKGIICTYDDETIVYFITNTGINDTDIVTNTVQKWGKNIFYGVVYEKNNKTPIKAANVLITLLDDDEVVEKVILETNENGEFVHFITQTYDKINVTTTYGDITHTYEVT